MKTKVILTLLLLAALAGCQNAGNSGAPVFTDPAQATEAVPAPTAVEVSYHPEYLPGPCPLTLPQGFVDGENVSCGTLVVPEDRKYPKGNQVELAVAYFHKLSNQPDTYPVVYVEGGPGVSALMPLQYTFSKFASLLQQHDVIFYDQRGVGLSKPALTCTEYFDFLDQTLELGLTPEENAARLLEVYSACYRRLTDEDIDLSMYNAKQSAHDLDDLRTALGIETWDLYAVSYGTRVALEVMRQHPQGVRSVVLDSVLPPEVDPIADTAPNIQHALDTFFASCKEDPNCSQAFPDLKDSFNALAASLDEQPEVIPVSNLLTGKQYNTTLRGSDLIAIITQGLYSAEVIPMIPMMITEAASGNYTKLSSLRSSYLTNAAFMSHGKYYSVLCHQEAPFTDAEKTAAVIADHPGLIGFLQGSPANSIAAFALCERWDVGTASPEQNAPVSSGIPALILNGQFDPATPSVWGQQAAEQLTNSVVYQFEAVGHSPSFSHPCPASVALAFLADPSSPPEISCAEEMKIAFVIPSRLEELAFKPVEVPEHHIQAQVPSDWIAVKPEYFISPDQTIELVVSNSAGEPLESFLKRWSASEMIDAPTYNQISWQVYPFLLPNKQKAGYVAASPNGDSFHFVLIVGAEKDQQALYENVFQIVLESFAIAN